EWKEGLLYVLTTEQTETTHTAHTHVQRTHTPAQKQTHTQIFTVPAYDRHRYSLTHIHAQCDTQIHTQIHTHTQTQCHTSHANAGRVSKGPRPISGAVVMRSHDPWGSGVTLHARAECYRVRARCVVDGHGKHTWPHTHTHTHTHTQEQSG